MADKQNPPPYLVSQPQQPPQAVYADQHMSYNPQQGQPPPQGYYQYPAPGQNQYPLDQNQYPSVQNQYTPGQNQYPPGQGQGPPYYNNPNRGSNNGCLHALLAAVACCCCLDCLF